MRIIDDSPQNLTITIKFDSIQEKAKVTTILHNQNTKIIGYQRGKQYFLDLNDIYYIELVDKQTFIYTYDDCYESSLWLYQLEEKLSDPFIRANKSTIFNMDHMESLKADIGLRIMVYLDNDDQIVVSRTYSKTFKKKLKGDSYGDDH